jgi:ABC-type transport system involved in multi-copper enzyme maturation permease subunit
MLGPVFSLELLLGRRRNRLDAIRRVLAGLLVLQFGAFFLLYVRAASPQTVAINDFVDTYYDFFVAEHFIFLLLIVPGFVAGAVTDEKAQGTLQQLLTADVTSWEVILGKLFGRLAQVAWVALASVPVFCLVAGSGYRPITPILCLAVLTVLVLVTLGAASIWASVRSRQTNEAVLRVYLWFGIAALVVGSVATWKYWIGLLWWYTPNQLRLLTQRLTEAASQLNCLNPVYVLEPTWSDNNLNEFGQRLKTMLLVYGTFSLVWLALAVWRLRPSTVRYLEGKRRRRVRLAWRRPMTEEPVLWRESGISRGLWSLVGVALVAWATYMSSRWILVEKDPIFFLVQGGIAGLLLSFIVGVRASGTISGERERQTWESLLLTPMDTWEIVEDKTNGVLQSMDPYFLAFLVPALVLSFNDKVSRVSAVGYTVSILLIDWAAMVYMAAAGVHSSSHALSSWRSLVGTIAGGYAYCFTLLVILAFAYVWLGCILMPLVWFFLTVLGFRDVTLAVTMTIVTTAAAGLSWLLWRRAVRKTGDTEAWIDSQERYGKNFVRSLTSALRKHYQKLAERQRQQGQPVDESVYLFGPPDEEGSELAVRPGSRAQTDQH